MVILLINNPPSYLALESLHNPALLQINMNLEPVAAINTSLDAAGNLLWIGFLLVLALWADNNEHHENKEAEQVYKSYARMSSGEASGLRTLVFVVQQRS